MRVISGSARGRRLQSPSGSRVRPTADRVKEALFSSLTSIFGSLEGLVALDLFTGTGSLGIEALSRGAAAAVFVDNSPDSLRTVGSNLHLTGLTGNAEIIRLDALAAVRMLTDAGRQFDIIFADPPYEAVDITVKLLAAITAGGLLTREGVLVLESSSRALIALPQGLNLAMRKVYGDTALLFLDQCQP